MRQKNSIHSRNVKKTLAFAFICLLTGCLPSSIPEAKDLTAPINEYWSGCKMVTATDITKTNGADRGDHYVVDFSYKMAFVQDVAYENLWSDSAKEPKVSMDDYNMHDSHSAAKFYAALHDAGKAQRQADKYWTDNCPAQYATLMKSIVNIPANQHLYGRSINKGEGPMIEGTFEMIKTEKGWLPR
ncbi:MAG: hypothetical protein Q8N13_22630 [Acidovorax sp.]|nr:hypothetical protein [Acidovorax sp.]